MKSFDQDGAEEGPESSKLQWLNFNKKITLITGGQLLHGVEREVLVVASENSVTGYGTSLMIETPLKIGSYSSRRSSMGLRV